MLRRETLYPARLSLSVSAETRASIDTISKRYSVAPSVIARWAVEAGIDKARERARRRARSE